MSDREYTVGFPFCGVGGGALGFLRATKRLLQVDLRFRAVGGIDMDPEACRAFEQLTKAPALCADMQTLTPAELRAAWGERAPDVVFSSPPCKGFSGLLSEKTAQREKYQQMNGLALRWVELMLAAWPDAPPRLVLMENVPRIASRGRSLITKIKRALNAAGYVCHASSHDCGELGHLAQHRKRFLLVARLARSVPSLLYKPIKRRVRGCGEVLCKLPVPGTEEAKAAGPLHELPRISWLNWVRLALIPAGGDWRDLRGVLENGQARRTVHRRRHVAAWQDPSATIAGNGTNGPFGVADPRAPVRLEVQPGNAGAHESKMRVESWDAPAHTVTSSDRIGSGAPSIADPRAGAFNEVLGIIPWDAAAGTVTGNGRPATGRFSVADPRVGAAFDHGYGVLTWSEPSPTVAGGSDVGQGAYAVADPRLGCEPRAGAYGVLRWSEAAATIVGAGAVDNGRFSIADPRHPERPVAHVDDVTKPPFVFAPGTGRARKRVPTHVVILANDGTWHRPLTTLELAVLQSFPATIDGKPFVIADGKHSKARDLIGNAVPPDAAEAIAEQMLLCLGSSDAQAWSLSSAGGVWVEPDGAEVAPC